MCAICQLVRSILHNHFLSPLHLNFTHEKCFFPLSFSFSCDSFPLFFAFAFYAVLRFLVPSSLFKHHGNKNHRRHDHPSPPCPRALHPISHSPSHTPPIPWASSSLSQSRHPVFPVPPNLLLSFWTPSPYLLTLPPHPYYTPSRIAYHFYLHLPLSPFTSTILHRLAVVFLLF